MLVHQKKWANREISSQSREQLSETQRIFPKRSEGLQIYSVLLKAVIFQTSVYYFILNEELDIRSLSLVLQLLHYIILAQ